MALHLITGRANAGKTKFVNARLAEALKRGETPVLVVPSMADVRRTIGEIAMKFPVGVRVTTWNTWLEELWRLHGDGRRFIEDPARRALLERVIGQCSLSGLESALSSRGLLSMVAKLVARMQAEPLRPRGCGAVDVGLLEACQRYDALVSAAGLVEPARASGVLAGLSLEGIGGIVANRFDTLNASQRALLMGLSCNSQVTVALTWDEGYAPTAALESVVRELAESASSWTLADEQAPPGEITDLLDGLYSRTGDVVSSGAVRFGLAGGSEAEAELAASSAVEAIGRGVAPDRVVIAFADLEPVVHRLRTALESRGIPFEVDVVRPVTRSALGASLVAALDLVLGDGGRTAALALLLGPHSDIAGDLVDECDRIWRGDRVTDSRLIVEHIQGTGPSRTAEALESLAMAASGPLTVQAAKHVLKSIDLLIGARATRVGSAAAPPDQAARLADDAAASRALGRALASMATAGGSPFTLRDFRREVSAISVGGTAGEHDGYVQVTEVARLHSRRFDAVIIGGLTSAEAPVGRTETLSEHLESLLGIAQEPGRDEMARLEFYLAISRARSQLVLVRKEESSDGAALRPSVLWEEVVDAYRGADEEPDAWPAAAPEPIRVRASDVVALAPVFTRGRREARERAASGLLRCPEVPRAIVSESALRALCAQETRTASEVEAYLQCPYRWFYERVVRPGEIDSEIDARAIGTLAHDLLRSFYELWNANSIGERVTTSTLEEAREIFARASAGAGKKLRAADLADELAIARAIRWAEGVVEDDADILPGFVSVAHELAFGEGEVDVVLGGVRFRGRIDRVDSSGEAIFVTDYKSSRAVTGVARFAEEGRVQAIVYAEAARHLMGDLPVAGSVYRSLRSHEMRGFWRADLLRGALEHGNDADAVGESGYEALVIDAEERIAGAVAGMREGAIERQPAVKSACAFCAIARQCGGAR